MAYLKNLDNYAAFLYPNAGKQDGRINLTCGDHKLYLLFVDPSQPLTPNQFDATSKIGVAYQPFSQFRHFLDLVRNEKPITVTFAPENKPPTFVVYCAAEPPGEGEM